MRSLSNYEADESLVQEVVKFSRLYGADEAGRRFGVSVGSVYRYQSQLNRFGKISIPRGLNNATRDTIRRGLRSLQDELATNQPATNRSVADWCLRTMDLSRESQQDFGILCGRYQTYRLSSVPGNPVVYTTVRGHLEFKVHETQNYPAFVFESTEEVALQGEGEMKAKCVFTGWATLVRDRIYLQGFGVTYGGEYMRSLIVKFGNPRKEPLIGVLFGETKPENAPMAARIALVHDELTNKNDIVSAITTKLESDSRCPHVLYGWGIHTKRFLGEKPITHR